MAQEKDSRHTVAHSHNISSFCYTHPCFVSHTLLLHTHTPFFVSHTFLSFFFHTHTFFCYTHYDRIALERHDYTATKAERIQNTQHRVLCLNADGPSKPLRQRPEFAAAVKECQRLQDAHLPEARQFHRPIHTSQQKFVNEESNNSKAEKTSIILFIRGLDGGTINSHR